MDIYRVLVIGRKRKCLDMADILSSSDRAFDIVAMLVMDEIDEPFFDTYLIQFNKIDFSAINGIVDDVECVFVENKYYNETFEKLNKIGFRGEIIRQSMIYEKYVGFEGRLVDKLCVLIPTYNRFEHISSTLEQLAHQTVSKDRFEIVVVDNASDYDISELERVVPDSLKYVTTIVRNSCNIGLAGTIANLFLRAKRKWNWFLADDDIIYEDAIEEIIADIERYGGDDVGVFQYLHFDINDKDSKEYYFIDSLEDFCIAFNEMISNEGVQKYDVQGTLVYLANKVFNIDAIRPFVRFGFQYANTMIPMDIPILKGLEQKEIKMIQHNVPILQYCAGRATWNMDSTILGLSTLNYINLKTTEEIKAGLMDLFIFDWPEALKSYMYGGVSNPNYLKTIYHNAYKYVIKDKEKDFFEKVIKLSETGEDIFFLRSQFGI